MSASHQQHLCSRKIKITGLVIQKCHCLAASSYGCQKAQESSEKNLPNRSVAERTAEALWVFRRTQV